jgi:hypothetical protein
MTWSFLTQRFAKKYPLWTKIRSDPYSFGQRLYSVLAERYESGLTDAYKTQELFRILSFVAEPEDLKWIALSEGDEYPVTLQFGRETITYPSTVTGTVGSTDYSVSRAETLEELLYSTPSRLIAGTAVAVSAWELWSSSSPAVFQEFPTQGRVSISVDNSTNYSTTSIDIGFGGHSGLRIKGYDYNYLSIEEFITVSDDGVYTPREILSEIEEVTYDGFDGDISIQFGHANLEYVEDPARVAVLPQQEGPLRYSLTDIGGEKFLKVWTPIYLKGSEYRRDGGLDEPNEEILAVQRLLDVDENAYNAIDIALSPYDLRLYVLADDGKVYVYDPGLGEFIAAEQESYSTYIELIPLYNRTYLNETLRMFTWFRVMRAPVAGVWIWRESPSGVKEYLQADYSWAAGSYKFPRKAGVTGVPLPEDSWDDKQFTSTFDELGQWDFYLEVAFEGLDGQKFKSHTAVLCESTTALVALDTGIASPTGLFFSPSGLLCVTEAAQYTPFQLCSDMYYADVDGERMFFKEDYDSVEVSYV